MDAVISFPKSGRTWLRVMLDTLNVPATYTHAKSGNGFGLHFTKLNTSLQKKYNKIIFLHRDPRDVVVSAFYQKSYRREEGYEDSLKNFIRSPNYGIEKIIRFNQMWIQLADKRPHTKVISYEELKTDAVSTLISLTKFLEQPRSEEDIQNVVRENAFKKMQQREQDGFYKESYGDILVPRDVTNKDTYKVRRGVVGGFVNEMDADDQAYCNEVMLRMGMKI